MSSRDPIMPPAEPSDAGEGPLDTSPTASATGSPLGKVVVAGAVLVAAGALATWALPTSKPPPLGSAAALPVIAEVPEFTLTERCGSSVSRDTLLGFVWVVDFVFTRCAGPCPTLSARMRSLQYALSDEPGAKLVSICLDPENDTPKALVHYAKRFNADAARWWFLTGRDEARVRALVQEGFLQSVVPATGDEPLMHSTYMVVVDRRGRIRSVHQGMDPNSKPLIVRDVKALLAEPRS